MGTQSLRASSSVCKISQSPRTATRSWLVRTPISSFSIHGRQAREVLLPLGAVTAVTPAWTEPLGGGTTVTSAWTVPLGAAMSVTPAWIVPLGAVTTVTLA